MGLCNLSMTIHDSNISCTFDSFARVCTMLLCMVADKGCTSVSKCSGCRIRKNEVSTFPSLSASAERGGTQLAWIMHVFEQSTGADPGFLERGFIKVWVVRFDDFISFFLNIPWKWNILVSGRPNYFISMGQLKTGGGEGVRAKLLNPLWIRHWSTITLWCWSCY